MLQSTVTKVLEVPVDGGVLKFMYVHGAPVKAIKLDRSANWPAIAAKPRYSVSREDPFNWRVGAMLAMISLSCAIEMMFAHTYLVGNPNGAQNGRKPSHPHTPRPGEFRKLVHRYVVSLFDVSNNRKGLSAAEILELLNQRHDRAFRYAEHLSIPEESLFDAFRYVRSNLYELEQFGIAVEKEQTKKRIIK